MKTGKRSRTTKLSCPTQDRGQRPTHRQPSTNQLSTPQPSFFSFPHHQRTVLHLIRHLTYPRSRQVQPQSSSNVSSRNPTLSKLKLTASFNPMSPMSERSSSLNSEFTGLLLAIGISWLLWDVWRIWAWFSNSSMDHLYST